MALNGGARRFSAVAVVRSGLALTWQHLFRFVGIVLAVVIPSALLTALAKVALLSGVTPGPGGTIDLTKNSAALLFVLAASLIAMLANMLIQAAIVFGTMQAMQGKSPAIGACLGQALARLSRLFPAGLLLFFGGGALIGTGAFIVTQIFGAGAAVDKPTVALSLYSLLVMVAVFTAIATVWVFVPAIVAEGAGPISALKRSAVLTKGQRWNIAGIVLLFLIANGLVSAMTRSIMLNGAPYGGLALNAIAFLFFMALAAALSAVGYVHLRAEKEGAGAAKLRVVD